MKIALQFEDIDNKHFALQLTWMDMVRHLSLVLTLQLFPESEILLVPEMFRQN